MAANSIKQLLLDTREYWDRENTPEHTRETFWKIIDCGTDALGAEVYASEIESKLVFHTCKSRYCPGCGQRATEEWQADLETILPDISYVGITFTMPMEFRPVLQHNRHILYGIPAMGAEAIQQWAKARYGVSLIVIVAQQTFGGFLNFAPDLHVMVSAGGLQNLTGRWIHPLEYDQRELMLAWRDAVVAFLSEASRKGVLKSSLTNTEFQTMLATQHKRDWNVFVGKEGPKAQRLKHDGRYMLRPPVAQHRFERIRADHVGYWPKDTRNKRYVFRRYRNEEFVDILMQHIPDANRHAMRFVGLVSPRSKAQMWAAVFVLLNQPQRPHPARVPWRWLRIKTFGTDPLLDSQGQLMQWTGRRASVKTT